MTASYADNEIWHVLVAADDMKRMNVDQMDDAFRLSLIDASTLVWKTGMAGWRRLGSIAGIDDEPEVSMVRPAPVPAPPPAPPPARPAPRASVTATAPAIRAHQFVAQTPVLHAPDPYVLPRRRVAIPSEVDFRRAPGGVRWGRWLVGFLLLTTGVLVAYRQNLLREGARSIGLENKYLASEHRVTAFVGASVPPQVKAVLERLALLPGPNAVAQMTAFEGRSSAAAPAATTPTSPAPAKAAVPNEPEVKTVSLESLPLLNEAAPAAKAPAPSTVVASPRVASKPAPAPARVVEKPSHSRASTPEVEAPAPKPKAVAEPKAEPKPAPPPANDNPLKAAIRMAIEKDSKK